MLNKIAIGVAVVLALGGVGVLGVYAYLTDEIASWADDLEERGFEFDREPPVLAPLTDVTGRQLDLGYARFVVPFDEPELEVVWGYSVVVRDGEEDVAAMATCNCDEQQRRSGPTACRTEWYLYSRQLKKKSFFELFGSEAEEIGTYMGHVFTLSIMPVAERRLLLTEKANSAIAGLLDADGVLICRVWDKRFRVTAELWVRSGSPARALEIARTVASTYEFTVEELPEREELIELVEAGLERTRIVDDVGDAGVDELGDGGAGGL